MDDPIWYCTFNMGKIFQRLQNGIDGDLKLRAAQKAVLPLV